MKNVFLSQFLMISEWKTIVFLIAYLLLAFAVYKLPKKKIQLFQQGADCDCARSGTGTCHAGGIRFCGRPDEDSVCE